MGMDRYLPFLPTILNWIDQTLDSHAREKRPLLTASSLPIEFLCQGSGPLH